MRIFGIENDGCFKEYMKIPFQQEHEEAILENWLEANPQSVFDDSGLLIIGRQVITNLGSIIDLLGIDRQGDIVVLELKRDRTPRETLAQVLEYASFVEELDIEQLEGIFQRYLRDESVRLADYHRKYFSLEIEEAISFNKDQRLVIIGQRVTDDILQTALFLRKKGVNVTCIEFSFFQSEGGFKLLSHDIVVGREPMNLQPLSSGSLPLITQEAFISSLDENGRKVFQKILEYASQSNLPIHWGSKGFSLNVDKSGVHVAICFGYPPNSVYKQSLYTALIGRGGVLSKLDIPQETLDTLWHKAEESHLFQRAGRELKCVIDRRLTDEQIEKLLEWLKMMVITIQEYNLK